MKPFFLTLLVLLGCKGGDGDGRKPGPPLTPATAIQLKALAPECEIKRGDGPTKELRLCKGRQATMTIHLDDKRNLREIEIGLWAPLLDEAKQLFEINLRGIVSDAALAAIGERLANTKSDPIVVDGVRVNAFHTQAPNENPRYTVTLSW